MIVYIDLLIVLNLLINYIFIKITALITSSVYTTLRILLSAFAGALCSIIILFDITLALSFVFKIASVILCCYIAFGAESFYRFIKNILVMSGIYMLFTGFLTIISEYSTRLYINNFSFYISINPVLFVVSIFCFYTLIKAADFFYFRDRKQYLYNIEIETDYDSFTGIAFYDTGFKVRDIVCNNDVIMCCLDFLKCAGALKTVEIIENFYKCNVSTEILPVFYSDVSGGGMMAGIKLNRVCIKRNDKLIELKNIVLAVSKNKFSQSEEIIFGKDIYDRLGN